MIARRSAINALFVTWDGPQSPYLESLFLPILAALRERGIAFHILQFGWSGQEEVRRIAGRCKAAGIPYRYQPIWRRPVALGSFASALAGGGTVRRAIRDWAIDLVMPRSYLPALAAIRATRASGCALVLDADGLPNDERLEFAGQSPGSLSYRVLDQVERWAVRSADAILVRTPDGADVLARRAAVDPGLFTIVANARDERSFRPSTPSQRTAARAELGISDTAPLAIFVGSAVTGKYDGPGLIALLGQLRALDPTARLLLVTPDVGAARALVAAHGVGDSCIVRSAAADEVPALIGAADVGLSLIHPTFSMRAASAIKTGEYLLCGVPVIATAGVGGVEGLLSADAGFVIDASDRGALAAAAAWFMRAARPPRAAVSDQCRDLGLRHFSLGAALDAYAAASAQALERRRS